MISYFLTILLDFDWKSLILGEQDKAFLYMVLIRTFIMFLVILFGLRMLGKRSVNQLSVFELGVIIGLGSAAGDPMFYDTVGLLSCVLVFAVVLTLYHLFKFIVSKNEKIRNWVEGKPVTVVDAGEICLDKIKKETSNMNDILMLLRGSSVSHLGQVRLAILEPDGDLSIYYFADEDVKYGMPIIPAYCEHPLKSLTEKTFYSCTNCSHTTMLTAGAPPACIICNKKKWVKAHKETRVS